MIQREIILRVDGEHLNPKTKTAGYAGEHLATLLKFELPESWILDKSLLYYVSYYVEGSGKCYRTEDQAWPIEAILPQSLMVEGYLYVQLNAVTREGEDIRRRKSASCKMVVGKSVCDNYSVADDDMVGLLENAVWEFREKVNQLDGLVSLPPQVASMQQAIQTKADADLSNVSNAAFLAKIASSGIGVPFPEMEWGSVIALADAGLARTFFRIGDTKELLLSTGEAVAVRIEDFDHEELAEGGKAHLTLGFVNALNSPRRMTERSSNYGGWKDCEMRTWLSVDLLAQIPEEVSKAIKTVNKRTSLGNMSSMIQVTNDKLWPFSHTEVGLPNDTNYSPGKEGVAYPLFTDDESRTKSKVGSEGTIEWCLRSPYLGNSTSFCTVGEDGSSKRSAGGNLRGVVIGFCI